MNIRVLWLLSALVACLPPLAHAHHSFAAVFDMNRVVVVEGVVTKFLLVNPHSMIYLDVTDTRGTRQEWQVEIAGRLNLTAGKDGWTDKSLQPGERVTITGNPKRDGTNGMSLVKLIRADGTELKTPANTRLDQILEERRQRRASQSSAPDSAPRQAP